VDNGIEAFHKIRGTVEHLWKFLHTEAVLGRPTDFFGNRIKKKQHEQDLQIKQQWRTKRQQRYPSNPKHMPHMSYFGLTESAERASPVPVAPSVCCSLSLR